MDVEDVLLGSNKYAVRVMGLVNILLHCNASNLIFQILKPDKTWGTICISVPHSKLWGTRHAHGRLHALVTGKSTAAVSC